MIMVTGATGNVGRELLPLLAGVDEPVRCLVHAGGQPLDVPGVEAVEGDLDRPEGHAAALEGCDRLFLLTPPHPDQVPREVALVDAAAEAGVEHVVALSVVGADPASPSVFGRWHGAVEEHLRASGLASTVLRPAAFTQVHLMPPSAAEGRWCGMSGDGAHAFVDVRDVAESAAAELTAADRWAGCTSSPAGRDQHAQAARAYGEALGREVTYVDLPAEEFAGALTGAGMPSFVVEGIVGLYAAVREGHAATTTRGVEEPCGRPPHAYEDVLDRLVRA